MLNKVDLRCYTQYGAWLIMCGFVSSIESLYALFSGF